MRQLFWILLILVVCSRPGIAGEPYPMMSVQLPSGNTITAEVAATRDKQIKGLMFRKELREDRGMLFLYPRDGDYGIWMKNCFISLDLIWLDRHNRIIYLKERVPPCRTEPCPTFTSPRKSRYVLEVHEGLAAKEHLGLGDQLLLIPSGL